MVKHFLPVGLVLTLAFLVVAGCAGSKVFSTSENSSAGGAPAVPPALQSAVTGVLVRADGQAQIIPTETPSQQTSGMSAQPLAGVIIRVEDPYLGVVETRTDSRGRFQIEGLAAGETVLNAILADGPARFPATLFPGAVAELGTTRVGRDQAVAKALAHVDADPDFAPEASDLFAVAPHNPIPAGVHLTQSIGTEEGPGEPSVTTLSRSQWLIYVDPTPYLSWFHPVRFYLVDAETGEMTIEERGAYPRLNEVDFYQNVFDYRSNSAVVRISRDAENFDGVAPSDDLLAVLDSSAVSQTDEDSPKTWLLVIDGHNTFESVIDAQLAVALLHSSNRRLPRIRPETLRRYVSNIEGGERPAAKAVEIFEEQAAKTREQDWFAVYITSHGASLGPNFQFDVEARPGRPATSEYQFLEWNKLDFSKAPACNVIVILETCFSAGAIRNGMVQFTGLDTPGRRFIVMAAAQRRGPVAGNAVSVPFYFPDLPGGGYYTNQVITEFRSGLLPDLPSPLASLAEGHRAARKSMDAYTYILRPELAARVRAQKPEFLLDLAPGEMCGPSPDPDFTPIPDPDPPTQTPTPTPTPSPGQPSVSFAPTPLNFTHLVQTTECPQALGNVRVTNTSGQRARVTITAPHPALDILPDGEENPVPSLVSELSSGGTLDFQVQFNCNQATPFETSLEAAVQGLDQGGSGTSFLPVNANIVPPE